MGLVMIGGHDAETETTYGDKPSLVSEMSQGYALGAEAGWWAELVLQRVQTDGASLDARLVPLPPLPLPPSGRGQVAAAEEPDAVQDVWELEGAMDSGLQDVSVARSGDAGTVANFFQGYRDAEGQYPEEQIVAMVWCESSWRIDPGGYHLGLAQFDPGTWAIVAAITGFTDPYNPYHQGYNVAVWSSMVSPGTTAGWPYCW